MLIGCKTEIALELLSYQFIANKEAFKELLLDADAFIHMMDKLIKKWGVTKRDGDLSNVEIIKKNLKLPVDLASHDSIRPHFTTISKFMNNNDDIAEEEDEKIQLMYVNAIFDTNLKGSQNPQTIALFRKLKEDRDP